MNISIAEFSRFEAKSQLQILTNKGLLLASNKLSENTSAKLFAFNGYYVVLRQANASGKVLSAEISNNQDWLYFFAENIKLDQVHRLLGNS